MRFIDLLNNPPPFDLIAEGAKLTEELKKCSSDEERKKFIDAHTDYWGKLKGHFANLSNGKCWYTEAKEISSHMHMDHFRPKKEVKHLEKGAPCATTNSIEPYWWLAFDWQNYRFSSSIPNTSKGNYFPLKLETPAASKWDELSKEFPGLLDPTDDYDVSMLTFDESGHVKPACDDTTWDADRVRLSVRIYDLDHVSLVDARVQIQNTCKEKILLLIDAQRDYAETKSPTYREMVKRYVSDLRAMTKPDAELSSVARNYIRNYPVEFIRNIAS